MQSEMRKIFGGRKLECVKFFVVRKMYIFVVLGRKLLSPLRYEI